MLRHYIEYPARRADDARDLERYLDKVTVFLSHSKHDGDGERIARDIRDWLHQNSGLSSFFDVLDIPAGTPFQEVLELHVKRSALVAVHTDSYSSREWCRREIIQAKRCNVPMILVNCVRDVDQRCFPYMGNVPNVRLDPGKEVPNKAYRIERVVGCLLDEVFKDFLWRCRIELEEVDSPDVLFMARPPELISLANIEQRLFENPESLPLADPSTPLDVADPVIVYPDPPLGAEEEQLFEEIMPRVRMRNLTRWLTEA
ncbi:MAG: toll/interleukin-1 receptor domain-containing protein [Gemmatimonadota bacterium]|nr:toll/interleukin-1 receptor domain-containing protein [Gemmatimonadota bacterium]